MADIVSNSNSNLRPHKNSRAGIWLNLLKHLYGQFKLKRPGPHPDGRTLTTGLLAGVRRNPEC
jgi:hypothetical protein